MSAPTPPPTDWHALAAAIARWGRALGFREVGIADTELTEAEEHLHRWLAAGRHGEMHYMAKHGTARTRPAELVPGTLASWDPNGRWFLTGTRVGGVSSFHFAQQGQEIIVDRDARFPGTISDDQLFQRGMYQTGQGEPYTIARRVSNLRSDGTARAERAVCFADICTVCTAKLERATHNAGEGEGKGLTLASELRGADWGPGYTFNVRVAGTIAYLIRQDGLHMIETADPAHPVELGRWKRAGDGYSNDVKLVDAGGKRYALIADYPVDIVDVTDPAHPRLVAQIPVEAHTLFTEATSTRTSGRTTGRARCSTSRTPRRRNGSARGTPTPRSCTT